MPRRIPPETLNTLLANKTGLEPVNIISIQWIYKGNFYSYCDRYIPGVVMGKLIEVADLEAVLDISKGGSTTSVKVVLDDTDGMIKNLFDTHPLYGRRVIIYQWFTQIPVGDAFPIFEGVVAAPIVWSEGDRSFSFDVVTKIDDVQVGFTVEDGNFTNVPPIILNKPWPLVFGTVHDMPTIQMDEIPVGTTRVPLGIPDANLGAQIDYLQDKADAQSGRASCLSLRAAEMMWIAMSGGSSIGFGAALTPDAALMAKGKALENQALSMQSQANANHYPQINRLKAIQQDQKIYDLYSIPIINGHRFHQGTPMEIKINGASYYGSFSGDVFNVISRMSPNEDFHRAPGGGLAPSLPSRFGSPVQGTQEQFDSTVAAKGGPGFKIVGDLNPTAQSEATAYWSCQPPYFFTINTAPVAPANTQGMSNRQKFWFAQAGATVEPGVDYSIRYIITIVPNVQVLWLSAKDRDSGLELITPIPPYYYELSYMSFGSVTALIATFNQPLSTIWDQHWSNDVYATVISPIGPNTVDILVWFIQNYTAYKIDWTSFNHVRIMVEKYPSSFPFYDKKNVVTVLKEIAWQARCAVWVTNDTWYIRYLPEQLTPVDTITEDDIEVATLQIECTPFEEIVTKFVALFQTSWALTDKTEICCQNNVALYGVVKRSYDFYIYNILDYVWKSAQYWTMIYSNIWKVLKCKTFLQKLTVETFDDVTINLAHNYACIGPVVGSTRKATFNSADLSIDLDIWLPVRLGEMKEYPLARPAGISTTYVFPDINEVPGVFVQLPQVDLNAKAGTNPVTPVWSVQGGGSSISDQGNPPANPTPPAIAEMPNYPWYDGAPPGGPTGQTPAQGAIVQPAYNYVFREPTPTPSTDTDLGAPSRPIPGIITAANDDNTYTVDLYEDGYDQPSTATVNAIVSGMSPDAALPESCTCTVIRQMIFGASGTTTVLGGAIGVKYTLTPSPFWLAPPADTGGGDF